MLEASQSGCILETRNITKRFAGITAVQKVSITINEGEVRAIMGENGAGKSTLCNMITGIFPPDEGELLFCGKKIHLTHPRQALDVGIRMVYQERNLIPYLTGAESICLGLEERKFGVFLNKKRIVEIAQGIRAKTGATVALDVPVSRLSPGQQQMVEILRALIYKPLLLILDEPTASLGTEEIKLLYAVIRELKAQNVAVIIITHKLDEVYEIADTISILRNGEHVVTKPVDQISRAEAVELMLGREIGSQYPEVTPYYKESVLFRATGVSDASGKVKNASFHIRHGEIVGFFGLVGAGRTELVETLFGLRKRTKGEIFLDEKEVKSPSVRSLVDDGVLLIPEDRRKNGIVYNFLNIGANLSLANLKNLHTSVGLVHKKKERDFIATISQSESLRIKFNDARQQVSELSGGNQQKVVIGRWVFMDNMKLLVMDEPTQGIDIGVKHDIYLMIREFSRKGIGVIFVSSELFELIGICDRMYIFKDGTILKDYQRKDFDRRAILGDVL